MGSEQAMDNKLKQYLVEELGELTYAEKQNIQKTLNWTFLEKELTKVSKQIKATIARIFLTGLLAIILFETVFFKNVTNTIAANILLLALIFVAAMVGGHDLIKLEKRKMIFKIFYKFSKETE